MRFGCLVLISTLAFACSGSTLASAQEGVPLTEKELMYLLEQKISERGLTDLVESYGVAFQATPEVLSRLRNAGARDDLLEVIRRKAQTLDVKVVGTAPKVAEPEGVPPPAREHFNLGSQKLKSLDYEGALEEFTVVERIQPEWDQVFESRGLALAGLGRYSEAASEWKKCLAVAPGRADKAVIQQKIAYWEGEADKIEKTRGLLAEGEQKILAGDAKGAISSFSNAVATSKSVGALLALARARLLDGDYAGQAEAASQAQTLDPQSAFASFYLADAKLREGASAQPALGRGLKFNWNLAYGQSVLARQLREKAAEAGGGKTATRGAGSSTPAEEHNRRGWVLWNGGHFQQAIDELQQAARLDSSNEGWHCDLAYARLARWDTVGGGAEARQAIRLNPRSACGHYALALALEKSGKRDEAAQEFDAAKKISSSLGLVGLLSLAPQDGDTATTRK